MATQYTLVPLFFLYCTIWSHKISTNAYKCKRQTTINYIRKPFSLLWQEWIYWDIHQRRMDWVFVVSGCQLLHIERMDNKFLLCSTGNYIQCPGITIMEKNFLKRTHMCPTFFPAWDRIIFELELQTEQWMICITRYHEERNPSL